MKTKKTVFTGLIMALVAAQVTLAAPAAQADDDSKNPAKCDLRIRPKRELVNTEVVAQLHGKWDYTGRNYWHDVGVITVGIAGAPLYGVGLMCIWGFYSQDFICDSWGERAAANRTRNSDGWYADAKKDLRSKCNKFLKKKYKDDIISSDGLAVTAEHYACMEPREERTSNGIKIVMDIVRGDPVYQDLSFDELQAKRCNRLLGCSARATSDEALDWIARKQMELGCN
ncbi:MAG: hypothetical protein A2X94_11680 [Bdellovibrionales bacterium GWB1_55_8]|nr:MAG: hypothetical protein A2X94_11680 [Bdellovibrionales bacterium GWB1_55_8]